MGLTIRETDIRSLEALLFSFRVIYMITEVLNEIGMTLYGATLKLLNYDCLL